MSVSSLGNARAAKLLPGEVSEWLMVPLSKSGRRKPRGFESRPLRGRRNSDASIAETLFTRQGPPGLRPAPHRAGPSAISASRVSVVAAQLADYAFEMERSPSPA